MGRPVTVVVRCYASQTTEVDVQPSQQTRRLLEYLIDARESWEMFSKLFGLRCNLKFAAAQPQNLHKLLRSRLGCLPVSPFPNNLETIVDDPM